jgi:hypothetical protein
MNERELISISDVKPEAVQWCWNDRIPLGGITLLDGDPGDGKSTILYDLSARVTTGRPMPFSDDFVGPAGVVLLQAEDLLGATVRPNLEAAGADLSRIAVFDRRRFSKNSFDLLKDISIIEKAIESTGAKLVIIDPLPAFLGNPNSEASVRKALSELAILAEAKNLAIVIVRHLTKGRSSQSKYRGSGSIGIIASARSALFVGHDPSSDDPHQHVLALNKSNLADAEPLSYRTVKQGDAITVEWLGKSSHTVDVLSESGADNFRHSQLDEACYVLYTILADHEGPMPATEVKKQAGEALVSPRTLKRAKTKLGVMSRRVSAIRTEENGKPTIHWVWELPNNDALLRPFLERSMREHAHDFLGCIEEVTESNNFEGTTEPEPSVTESNGRSWEEVEEPDSNPEPVLESPEGRPWND